MPLAEVRVEAEDLQVGMYISKLDRPWLETPFLFQGFVIRDNEMLEQVRQCCQYAYIDAEQGLAPTNPANTVPPTLLPTEFGAGEDLESLRQYNYATQVPLKQEYQSAKTIHRKINGIVGHIMDNLRAGKSLDVELIKQAISPMVDSVLRNPDAFIWLTRLRNKDTYIYNHSLNASVWAAAFGRQLGLPKVDLEDLSLGALLFDVGKTQISNEILVKPEHLTPEEFTEVKRHVEYGIDLLNKSKGVNERVLAMVSTHHERFNGRGYPKGLAGEDIPLFGRIAAIVDCYDAMTSKRYYAEPMSPYSAVKKLYEWRDEDFQAELVEKFIQAIGIHPAGTVVELSSGDVGVVVAQNRVRRLRPKVMLILDRTKQRYKEFRYVNLLKTTEDEQGKALDIARILEPGSYGIDPAEFYL